MSTPSNASPVASTISWARPSIETVRPADRPEAGATLAPQHPGAPDPLDDVALLSKLRADIGPARFAAILKSLDADSQAQLLATLDDFDGRQAGDDTRPQG